MTATERTVVPISAGKSTRGNVERAAEPVVPVARRRLPVLRWAAYGWLGLVILLAVVAPWLPLSDYGASAGGIAEPPSWNFDLLLGTDQQGRSVLTRLVFGARASLIVGLVATLVAFTAGLALGLLAGYLRGRVDSVVSFVADTVLAFPTLVLLLALASVLQTSMTTILIALAVVVTPTFIRLARANTLAWAERDFVTAAENLGASPLRIMRKEILPNVIPAVAAYTPVIVAIVVIAEGSLSFLGFGIPTPTPSWGGMISEGQQYIATKPQLVFIPAAAVFLTVLALNVLGDSLRARVGSER